MKVPSVSPAIAGCLALVATLGPVVCAIAQTTPDQLLLKDYRPKSIYRLPETQVPKARFPVIDVHSHDYTPSNADVDRWVRTMDDVGIEKTIVLSGATGVRLDAALAKFGRYPGRFIVWCGFDYAGFDQPGYGPTAVAELERCAKAGAMGVGELSDKGRGLGSTTNRLGMNIDDDRLDPLLRKCADLGLPINIHIGEDQWMYEPMDATNDGLMNAWKWRIEKAPGVLTHDEVIATLDRALAKHPKTTFVACHLANCCADLDRLGDLLDRHTNLYADIGARFAELSPIPRQVARFFGKYRDRLMYGTDNSPAPEMYRESFRLLESADEHFYLTRFSKYHWPAHGWNLPEDVLQAIYRGNAARVLMKGK
ncbi:MAG: amidohydrolase family protein [Verrucomicrobiales bacterium]|nr:amidohydrolase family protein [Verrucomicrobiales bacterium]